jgi:tight adherence protein C
MSLLLITLALFLAISTLLFAFGAAWLAPTSAISTRLQQLAGFGQARKTRTWKEKVERTLAQAGKVAPRSASELSKTELFLTRAGFRESRHLPIYFGIRVVSAVMAFALLIFTGWGLRKPLLLLLLPLLAYVIPKIVLFRMIKRRQTTIKLSLPDALDLLVICVEAGLGLDQALSRVSREVAFAHPQLSEELQLATLETRAGRARGDALRNLVLRTGVDDIRALVAVLIQTDRFGTSVAQALRVHSDSLRTERRQRAEEAAAKTTIKMVPVLVLCLFPSMFIVSIGPAAIGIYRDVRPMLGL